VKIYRLNSGLPRVAIGKTKGGGGAAPIRRAAGGRLLINIGQGGGQRGKTSGVAAGASGLSEATLPRGRAGVAALDTIETTLASASEHKTPRILADSETPAANTASARPASDRLAW
jgi:hypothetical protein